MAKHSRRPTAVGPSLRSAIEAHLRALGDITDPPLAKMLARWRDDPRVEDLWRAVTAKQQRRVSLDDASRFVEFVIDAWRMSMLPNEIRALHAKRDAVLHKAQRTLGEMAKAKLSLVELAEVVAAANAALQKARADLVPKMTGRGRTIFYCKMSGWMRAFTGQYHLDTEVGVLAGIVFDVGKDIEAETVSKARRRARA